MNKWSKNLGIAQAANSNKSTKSTRDVKPIKETKDSNKTIVMQGDYNLIADISQSEKADSWDFTDLSPKRLQEAVIWSEILGKPMCKRRERR